ncbi:hypothetical protein BVG16_26340 [Paenibacillus selenitireducens]|uniref:YneQ n=1 Tax=Paenibacillus selenitireducens TaxID=1324314 RepID=A0A1T2X271_9BACL|nr:hypothetical protein [Paenibacillus selenitireducens]OPA73962.1 hypothetical protein BVG16_26340 [Paenibacillus selenitireducens]
MAFGIRRQELQQWKETVSRGEIAYITHFWLDPRFPGITTVTKVGCSDITKLAAWCTANELPAKYIHHRDAYPHFDLIGPKQIEILKREQLWDQIERFRLLD